MIAVRNVECVKPDLDQWLARPSMRVLHQRESTASAEQLWEAARDVRLSEVGRLGRLIRWRIPGLRDEMSFDQLFREPPFIVLEADRDGALVSGLVGRIWTLRRDYPELADAEEYLRWHNRGTAQVLFANWVEPRDGGGAALCAEVRVQAIGRQGQVGLALVRPLVSAFQQLVGSEGIAAAVRRAESG
jgi:hypothetical protein